MKTPSRFLLVIAICSCLVLLLSGCNTMKGLGQDIEKAGEAIQGSAE